MDCREHLTHCTDNELMGRTAQGDKTAYEVLVLRYRTEAERYAGSLILSDNQAEDIVQDSFADIYVQRNEYRSTFSFRTYLYAVIRHKALDYLRKAGRIELMGEAVPETETGGERSPEEEFLKTEEKFRIAQWIAELPENYRTALYLFCAEGWSYQQIALHMKKSTAQVRIWIHRARKNLQKRRLEEQ